MAGNSPALVQSKQASVFEFPVGATGVAMGSHRERKEHMRQARQVARAAARSNLDITSREKKRALEEEHRTRKRAGFIAKEVRLFFISSPNHHPSNCLILTCHSATLAITSAPATSPTSRHDLILIAVQIIIASALHLLISSVRKPVGFIKADQRGPLAFSRAPAICSLVSHHLWKCCSRYHLFRPGLLAVISHRAIFCPWLEKLHHSLWCTLTCATLPLAWPGLQCKQCMYSAIPCWA